MRSILLALSISTSLCTAFAATALADDRLHPQDNRWDRSVNDRLAAGVDSLKSFAPSGMDFTSSQGFTGLHRDERVLGATVDFSLGAQTGSAIEAPGMDRFRKPHAPTIPMFKLEWR